MRLLIRIATGILGIGIISLCTAGELRAEEPQNWNALTLRKEGETWTPELFFHSRAEQLYERLSLYQITGRLYYRTSDWLMVGGAYSFFWIPEDQSEAGEEGFENQHRIEFEANPTFTLNEIFSYRSRNRIEFLYDESPSHLGNRFRHRSGIEASCEGMKFCSDTFLQSFYSTIEVFYTFENSQWSQYRYIPVGARVELYDNVILSVYPLIQGNRPQEDWSERFITGMDLNFTF